VFPEPWEQIVRPRLETLQNWLTTKRLEDSLLVREWGAFILDPSSHEEVGTVLATEFTILEQSKMECDAASVLLLGY
jgi:hypothetical protein